MNSVRGAVLTAQRVTKSFRIGSSQREHRVLNEVSMQIRQGEWVALMGASGSGRTTFLKCASGIVAPDSGEIEIAGRDILAMKDDEKSALRQHNLAYVFQDYNLIDELTVEQNIALPVTLGRNPDRVSQRISSAMTLTGIEELSGRKAFDLSGGEKQRVALARAVAQQPSIIFADEPTGALDSRTARAILQLFRQLVESGIGILMVTHDLFAASQADRVIILRDGAIQDNLLRPSEDEIFARIHEQGRDE